MKIFYVHHALRDKGNPPTQEDGILPLGIEDANLTGKIFSNGSKHFRTVAIYTSPYFRCKETARIINTYLNVPIIEDHRLNEFGSVHKAVKGEDCSSGQETWKDCQQRITDLVKEIVNKYEDADMVICVTSGVNLTAFVNIAYGLDVDNARPFPIVASCSPIGFDINKSHFSN